MARGRHRNGLLLAWLIFVAMWGTGAYADTRDVIVGKVAITEPLSVAAPALGGQVGKEIHRTLLADLRNSHSFTIVPYDGPNVTRPSAASSLIVPRGATYLVVLDVQVSGNEAVVSAYLLEAGRGRARWARQYRLVTAALRQGTHQIADDIHKEVTGRHGFASTRIAYVAQYEGHPAIFTVGPDGQSHRRLVSGKFACLFPKYAPGRNWLVYTAYKRRFPELYLIDEKSGRNHALSSRPGLNSFGAISPDGLTIAATLSFCGNPEIYLLSMTGKVKKRLTEDRSCDLSPSWSPDGKQLVYVNDSSGKPQLYVTAADGSGKAKRITWPFNSSSYCVEPDWSPQGESIVFCAKVSGNFDVMQVHVKSGEVTALTEGGPQETSPSWAPDGRHVVFATKSRGRTGLTILDTKNPNNRFNIPLPASRTKVRSPSWQRVVH